MRWKHLSALIVISLLWPVCGYAQTQPAQPETPAPRQAAAPEPATQVRAFKSAQPARPGASGPAQNVAVTPVDPQLKADILHLFAVMHVMQELHGVAQARLGRVRPTFYKMLPDTPHRGQIADEIVRKLQALITSQEFEDNLVSVYAKYLNDEQVKSLIQIYQSPAWQHFMAIQGSLLEGVRQAGQEFTVERSPAIYAGLCSEYPELRGKAMFCPATPAKAPAPAGPEPKGPAPTGKN